MIKFKDQLTCIGIRSRALKMEYLKGCGNHSPAYPTNVLQRSTAHSLQNKSCKGLTESFQERIFIYTTQWTYWAKFSLVPRPKCAILIHVHSFTMDNIIRLRGQETFPYTIIIRVSILVMRIADQYTVIFGLTIQYYSTQPISSKKYLKCVAIKCGKDTRYLLMNYTSQQTSPLAMC